MGIIIRRRDTKNNKRMKGDYMKILENTYGNFLQAAFIVLNPFKKAVIKTQCKVHKYINVQALEVLKNDGYKQEYNFFSSHIMPINDGAYWADQDFKSSGHFYNPHTKKGLYGRGNAADSAKEYYEKALTLWSIGEFDKAMFYFGAATHLVQDMTIPQHANIRLMDNHKQYETFVRRTYRYVKEFRAEKGSILFDTINEYIRFNARVAMKVHKKFKVIRENEQRYYRTTRCVLPLAERTTAGCMVMFYKDIMAESHGVKH